MRKTPENLSKETVDEGSATSHRLKWSLLPPNDLRIAQDIGKEKQGKKEQIGRMGNHITVVTFILKFVISCVVGIYCISKKFVEMLNFPYFLS